MTDNDLQAARERWELYRTGNGKLPVGYDPMAHAALLADAYCALFDQTPITLSDEDVSEYLAQHGIDMQPAVQRLHDMIAKYRLMEKQNR